MILFDRHAQLKIVRDDGAATVIPGDFRFSFTFEKTRTSDPNKLDAKIYNLAPATIDAIVEKGASVELSIGYGDSLELVFTGDIESSSIGRAGVDRVLEISALDGHKQTAETRVTISAPPGASTDSIIDTIIDAIGLPTAVKEKLSGAVAKLNNGFSFEGVAKDALDKITKAAGIEWSVQDGAITVSSPGAVLDSSAVLLSPSTGLVNSPRKTETGHEIDFLLVAAIRPGRVVEVDASTLSGQFVVDRVTGKGDTFGKDWTGTAEIVPLN